MIMLAGTAVMILIALLTGGRLQRIGAVGFRANWLLVVGIGAQILILETPLSRSVESVLEAVHVASYAFAGAWVVVNRKVPGLMVLGLGGLLNFLAITANGGVMPAYPQALSIAGIEAETGFSNSAASTRSLLWFFGDIFAIPRELPLANVFSIGDILILVGAGVFLMVTTRTPVRRDGAGPDDAEAPAHLDLYAADPAPERAEAEDTAVTPDAPQRVAVLQALVEHLSREVAALEDAAAARRPSVERVEAHPQQVQH